MGWTNQMEKTVFNQPDPRGIQHNSSKTCVETPKTILCNVTPLDILTPLF